jgi:hypothetical protein
MNRDKNGRFMKTSKELSVGHKITSFDQLKEGMIVDFTTSETDVNNAVIIFDKNYWYALHNNYLADGDRPNHSKMIPSKKYGWDLGSPNEGWPFGEDYKHMIFRGWYKPEVKKEVQSMYKIGDMVKYCGTKHEIIGVYEDRLWLKHKYIGSYGMTTIGNVSPWIEPVKPKFQVGDLVFTKRSITVEIMEISKDGVSYIGKDMFGDTGSFTEKDILRKIGTVT